MALEYVETPLVDGPGPDVGERHGGVHMSFSMRYHVPNPAPPRHRGGRTYPREQLLIHRGYTIAAGPEAMDPLRGPAIIARLLAQFVYRRLTFEGWPRRIREHEGDIRPGAPPRP